MNKEELLEIYAKYIDRNKLDEIFNNQMNLTELEKSAILYYELKNRFTEEEKNEIFNCFTKIDNNIKSEDDFNALCQNTKLKINLMNNPEEEIKKDGELITIPAKPELGFNYPFMIYIPNNLDKDDINNLLLHSCNTPTAMIDYSKSEEYTKINQLQNDSIYFVMSNKGNVPLIMPIIPRYIGYNPEYIEDGMQRSNLETFMDMQSELNPKYQMIKEQIEYEYNRSQNIINQQMKMCEYAIMKLKEMGINMDDKIIVEGHSTGSKNAASLINQYPERVASYVIGGTTGIAEVNDKSIRGIVYNGKFDSNNPAEFYYDENGVAHAKYKDEYSDEYIQKVVEPRYKESLKDWQKENPDKDIKEFDVVQFDIEKQSQRLGKNRSILVTEDGFNGHNAINSNIVREESIKVVKKEKELNKLKKQKEELENLKINENSDVKKLTNSYGKTNILLTSLVIIIILLAIVIIILKNQT